MFFPCNSRPVIRPLAPGTYYAVDTGGAFIRTVDRFIIADNLREYLGPSGETQNMFQIGNLIYAPSYARGAVAIFEIKPDTRNDLEMTFKIENLGTEFMLLKNGNIMIGGSVSQPPVPSIGGGRSKIVSTSRDGTFQFSGLDRYCARPRNRSVHANQLLFDAGYVRSTSMQPFQTRVVNYTDDSSLLLTGAVTADVYDNPREIILTGDNGFAVFNIESPPIAKPESMPAPAPATPVPVPAPVVNENHAIVAAKKLLKVKLPNQELVFDVNGAGVDAKYTLTVGATYAATVYVDKAHRGFIESSGKLCELLRSAQSGSPEFRYVEIGPDGRLGSPNDAVRVQIDFVCRFTPPPITFTLKRVETSSAQISDAKVGWLFDNLT